MLKSALRWCIAVIPGLLLVAQTCPAAAPVDFLTANIDPSVKAGDDFFQYANGTWLKRNPIPPTDSAWGVDSLVREQLYSTLRELNARAAETSAAGSDDQKIGDFWRTAIDAELAQRLGVAPLARELARIDAVKTRRQALDAAFALHPLGVDALFEFLVDQDEKESHVVSVHVFQGGLGLPDRDFYVNDDESVRQTRAAYVRHLGRMLRLLGRADSAASADATALMRFETALAKVSRKMEDTRDPLTNYNRIAPADFTRRYTPSIDWTQRLAAWNLRPDYIVVAQPEYFGALEKILAQTPLAVIKDYLRFHLVAEYAPYLGPALDAENFDFYKRVLTGQKEEKPRWERVLDVQTRFRTAANPIGMMVGRRFVATQFPEAAKNRYRDLVQVILGVYRERIGRLHWMSEATKAKAREKLASVDPKVGYPDRWPDHSTLVIGRASYCENMMNTARWLFQSMLARFGKPVDRAEWRMTPQTYNAYYNGSNNEIVLPAAVFAIPGVADRDVDDAVAYAYAGAATIGHEITHGFDDAGRKFDAAGNLADWWTADDATKFEKRAAVVVKQFDAYEPVPGFRINGKASLGENIADFGGLVLALDAFKTTEQYKQGVPIAGMTPLQRFFLAYAYAWMSQQREEQTRRYLLSDVHAPAKWRVLGPLSNLPEFYEAFGVGPGQAMWRAPEERADVW